MSTFVMRDAVTQEEFDWGTIGWRLMPATGARQLVVMDVVLHPGGGHDFHRHPGQEEMIIVQSGEIIQFIEQDSSLLGVGRLGVPGARRHPRVVQPGRRCRRGCRW